MRDNVKEIVRLAAGCLEIGEPILEIGSYQVEGQEGYADLRPFFPGKKYVGCDMRPGPGVDRAGRTDDHLSFTDDSFATIVSCDALEHVYDLNRFINDVRRVLTPGGLFLTTSVMYFPIHNHPHDYWRFTPEAFRRLLGFIGEPLILTHGLHEFPHTVIGVVRKGAALTSAERAALTDAVAGIPPKFIGCAWAPPRSHRRRFREKLARSIRKRIPAWAARALPAASAADPAAPPAPLAAPALSAFDVDLSRRWFDSEVWRGAFWLGFPILQLPTDLMALQELLSRVRPRVVVECGTNRGGGTVFFASILHALGVPSPRVISVDIVEPQGLREQLDRLSFGQSVTLFTGSSTDREVFRRIRECVGEASPVLVFLDSDHSYAHVLAEMKLYHALVTPGSHLVVFDTICKYLAGSRLGKPEWAEDNPLRAVEEFLPEHPEFKVEREWEKYQATFAPCGFLRKVETIGR